MNYTKLLAIPALVAILYGLKLLLLAGFESATS